MCHQIKIISRIKKGHLSICEECNMYHLTFNNLFFEFTEDEFKSFKRHLSLLEIDYWENKYSCQVINRKIPIPTLQQNLVLIFNRREIEDLKVLIFAKSASSFKNLRIDEIDYAFFLN